MFFWGASLPLKTRPVDRSSIRQGDVTQWFGEAPEAIDRFPNNCLGARRGKYLVAKGCYGPLRILLSVNPPRFPVCYSV